MQHTAAIFNYPALDKETTIGITKLLDDIQQHVATLESLNAPLAPHTIVYALETKFPKGTRKAWESEIKSGEMSALRKNIMYIFLRRKAVSVSICERTNLKDFETESGATPAKRQKIQPRNRVLTTTTSKNCIACKSKRHPLFLCKQFKQLSIPKRIELIKGAKLCYNCIRSHLGEACKHTACTICGKKHNTLLHLDQSARVDKASTSKSETTQTA